LMETVAYTKQRVLIEKGGKPVAALVSVADLQSLESTDSKETAEARRKAAQDWLARANEIRAMLEKDMEDRGLPSAADLLREAREERMNDLP
jgi:prevent-host-death family protein